MLVVAFSSGFVVLTYVAARSAPPLVDDWLIQCDRVAGVLHDSAMANHARGQLLGRCVLFAAAADGSHDRRSRPAQSARGAGAVLAADDGGGRDRAGVSSWSLPAIGPCAVDPSADMARLLAALQGIEGRHCATVSAWPMRRV